MAVFAEIDGSGIRIEGMVGKPDGSAVLRATRSGSLDQIARLSAETADDLVGQGAAEIIASLS